MSHKLKRYTKKHLARYREEKARERADEARKDYRPSRRQVRYERQVYEALNGCGPDRRRDEGNQ